MTKPKDLPPLYLQNLVAKAVGKKCLQWSRPNCGLSSALRFSVQLADHNRVFVKAATDTETAQWLRIEHLVLSTIQKPFMPRVIAWIDEVGTEPVLISQDLSEAYWPASHKGVSWREGDFDLLFNGIKELSAVKVAIELPSLNNQTIAIWSKIANDPSAFLNLKLCSATWLTNAITALVEAESNADVTGPYLVHGDLRSDNVCFLGSQVMFVDWSHTALGNSAQNLAMLLPTLYLEGGPAPYQLIPNGGREAALGCAAHIKRLATDASMPQWLKKVFKKLIAIELEWAAQCLGLGLPDGIKWQEI